LGIASDFSYKCTFFFHPNHFSGEESSPLPLK